MRTATTTAALLIILAVIGTLAGPQWEPQPLQNPLTPTTTATDIGGVDAARSAGANIWEPGTFEVSQQVVTIQLAETTVEALLRIPVGAPGDVPGMVFVHGAGTGLFTDAFVDQAHTFASMGIATLVPNKNLETYDMWHRDYVDMAQDYLRSVAYLRSVDGVDASLVGVYGESEGTWIVPIMQVHDPDIPWTVLVSPPVVPPREQAAFAINNYLRATGVPGQIFRAIPRAVGIQFPGQLLDYADFDVTDWLRQQSAPILVVYGTDDDSMPIIQGAQQIIAEAAIAGPQAPVTVRYYQGADHGIRDSNHQVDSQFQVDVGQWVLGMPYTAAAEPRVAGGQPHQEFLATPVPRPPWWGNGDWIIGTVGGGMALLLVGPLVWLVYALVLRLVLILRPDHLGLIARDARQAHVPIPGQARMAPEIRPLLLGLSLGTVLTTAALLVYLVAVAQLALGQDHSQPVTVGGWIGVRLLGIFCAIMAARIYERARAVRVARAAGDSESMVISGWPAHLTLWTSLAGASILLLWLAYWGVFQLGI